ncbi:divalent cation tolerance protein CutA [Streptomyces sp. NPDC057545]|uniref:divalent cation tolerance protein CutA n=1 Tax=Streptomyces sp. NPDC057545 TaxID=3346164 RepID=UPI0036A62D9B
MGASLHGHGDEGPSSDPRGTRSTAADRCRRPDHQPVTSVFWHHGEYGTGEEWQVLLKTTADQYPAPEAHLLERHPWDNPELCAVPEVDH